jgi:hypothetical protein
LDTILKSIVKIKSDAGLQRGSNFGNRQTPSDSVKPVDNLALRVEKY